LKTESNLFSKNKFPTQTQVDLHELYFHPLGYLEEHPYTACAELSLHTTPHRQGGVLTSLYCQNSISFLQVLLHRWAWNI